MYVVHSYVTIYDTSLYHGSTISNIQYKSIKCHHTVTVITCTLVLLSVQSVILSHYCGVELTSIPITIKTTIELL